MLTTHPRTRFWLSLVLVLAALSLAACGGDKTSDKSASKDLTQTSIQLSWVHTIEFAGIYEADAKGYYAEQGLAVEALGGGYDADGNFIDPIQQVVSGQADFGVTGGDSLLLARAQGQPVVAIATIYQQNPVVLIALANKNIVRPQDLVGKRIGIQPDTVTEREYVALLREQQIDRSTITEIPLTTFDTTPLTSDELDVYPGFITNQPVSLRQAGYDITLILPGDYGIDFYGNVIFTSEETIANRPELVTGFLRATVHGYEQAMSDPAGAAAQSVARNSDLTLEDETASMQASLPLLQVAGSEIGMMEPDVWQFMHNVLVDQGLLEQPVVVEDAYTLHFLNEIYP